MLVTYCHNNKTIASMRDNWSLLRKGYKNLMMVIITKTIIIDHQRIITDNNNNKKTCSW